MGFFFVFCRDVYVPEFFFVFCRDVYVPEACVQVPSTIVPCEAGTRLCAERNGGCTAREAN
jgi:hypothetical protein